MADSHAKHPPTREELQRSLAQVHSELAASPRLDAEARRLLREVLVDIERLLQTGTHRRSGAAPDSAAPSAPASAPRRLEDLAVRFEAQHPVLAGSVRQFIDLLGRAGL
jgi:hypothetical protein